MKTPGLAHQLISIQCTVNTDQEQKSKVTPTIILKYIGIILKLIGHSSIPQLKQQKVHGQFSVNISSRSVPPVQRVLSILSDWFLTDSPVVKCLKANRQKLNLVVVFERHSPCLQLLCQCQAKTCDTSTEFYLYNCLFLNSFRQKEKCVRPVLPDSWTAWPAIKLGQVS